MWLNQHLWALTLFVLLILTFYHSAAWASDALVCLGTWCTWMNMIWYDIDGCWGYNQCILRYIHMWYCIIRTDLRYMWKLNLALKSSESQVHAWLLWLYMQHLDVSNSKWTRVGAVTSSYCVHCIQIDLGGGCNQLLLCALRTICSHAPRHERPSEPSHFPLAWQMPLLLPINLNPALQSYKAMLLYVVVPLTKVTVPLGWNVGGPQSTTVMGGGRGRREVVQ